MLVPRRQGEDMKRSKLILVLTLCVVGVLLSVYLLRMRTLPSMSQTDSPAALNRGGQNSTSENPESANVEGSKQDTAPIVESSSMNVLEIGDSFSNDTFEYSVTNVEVIDEADRLPQEILQTLSVYGETTSTEDFYVILGFQIINLSKEEETVYLNGMDVEFIDNIAEPEIMRGFTPSYNSLKSVGERESRDYFRLDMAPGQTSDFTLAFVLPENLRDLPCYVFPPFASLTSGIPADATLKEILSGKTAFSVHLG